MKRLYKKSLYKIFVSLFIIFYSFLPQTIVIGQVIDEYSQGSAAPTEEVIIPEESLPQEEVVLPEEIPPVVEEPLVEETQIVEPVVEEPIVNEPIIEQPVVEPKEVLKEVLPYPATWVLNGDCATTYDVVKLGETYIAPQNSKVRIIFTKLPENPSKLTIQEITLTQEEIAATGAISDKAYDIKTDMIDGTFEYDLTLPSTQEDTKVVYAEHREDIFTDLKEVTNTIVNEGDTLKIEDLEHFTIFIVKSPDETISDSGVDNENNAWVSDNNYATFDNRDDYAVYGFPDLGIPSGANIEGIEVLVEGKTTGRDLDISIWNQSNSSPDAYTSTKTADLSSSESTVIIGGSADKWGKSWIDTDFNTDFKIRVDAMVGGGTASLDQIRVKVSYSMPLTPPTLTNDSSDPVALTSVGGVWTSIGGGSGHTGVNTSEIRWGSPAGSQKSGLRFTNSGLQSFDTGETFYLGMLTHMNWGTYAGTAASGATLQITLNFDKPNIPDVVLGYDFDIEETSNSSGNCMPYQISSTPCDDKITFPNSYGTQVFTIGDIQYTLVIDGFVDSYPDGSPVSAFITEEEKENSAFLVGHLSSVLVEKPEIRLTKKTNDQDITAAPGQNLYIGDVVEWKYIIQNSGNVALTNVSITDSPSANIDCDSVTSGLQNSGLTLASGETVTCTASGTVGDGSYSNTATATGTHSSGTVTASDTSWYTGINKSHLIVQKTTVPASDPTTFGISISTTNGTVFEDVNGSISDSTDYDYTVSAGTYSITETVPTGWQKTGDTCQNVTVGIGETKTCTITNTKDTGTLIVKKVVNNNYGGTLSFSDFSFKINGGNDISFESDGQNDIEVNTGKYSVVENSKTGYQTTYDNCSDIQIDPGETETCTITNSDIQPKLTVTKIVSGGTKVVGDFELLVNSTSVVSGVQNGFNAGTYTVNETPDSDYTAVISGDCASNGLITLNVGDEKECTITNTRDTGNLKVVKTVDYGNASDWYFSLNGGNPIQADSNGVVDFGQVDTNQNHTIVESGPLGIFYLGSITGTNCTPNIGNKSATATVTKDATTTCTFSNLVNRGSISIIKDSIPNDSQDFSFITTGAGLSSFSLDDDQDSTLSNTKTFTSLLPGTYTITEVGAEGWDFTKVQCVSNKSIDTLSFDNIVSLNLQAGENVTCTFTNTKKGKIILEKQVLPDGNSQTFSFTGELAGTIGDGQQLSKQVVPGTYTVSESPFSTSGYRLTDIACDDIDSTYDISTGTTTFNVEAGETVKCIYTNEIFGSVTAHKYHDLDEDKEQNPAEPNLSGWEMSLYNGNDCQGDPYMQGVTNSSGDITFNSIIPGDYSVMETLQSGWENVSDICQNFTVTPAEKEIVNFANIELKPITINAHKIECTNELELPNWGNGGDNIDENTALNWVKNHSSCSFKQGHSFQWGNEGPSSMNPGDNTGETTDTRWHTFGATDTNGLATIEIANKDIEGFNSIWMREVWNSDYIPFTYNIEGGNNSNNVTAEIYCHTDVLNYDNLDRIDGIENGETYYCVAWNVKANPEIEVEKSGPDYAINGENITYEYEVTNKGNVPLSNISVVDDKCNPVVYQSGDDGDNILENGEEWKYQCTTNILWTFPDSFTNEAVATGSFYDEETTDSDEFTLYPFTLRKDVLLYWDGDKIDYSDPETEFTVDIKKGDEVLGTETITESLPINLWLSEGSYKFCEKDLPEGYIQGYECIDYTTGQRYPDWSQINVITFDLAIDKIAPSVAYKGETITYEYEVKNGGPANVTPMVKDDLCTPVEYDSGDINMDGKIDSNETWKFTCDYKVTESGGATITNTATVHDQEGEGWDYTGWYLGGDINLVNNTDTENTPVRAGSIRVCKLVLTPDGQITNGSEVPGFNFSITGLNVTTSQGAPAGVLPQTSYSTPLTLNTNLYSSYSGNDVYCKTYDDLSIGHFYYGEESYQNPWNEPKYNDSDLNWSNAISYSGQLFDADSTNDGQRNTVGDGDILLTQSRLDRTLLVVNQYPYSSIQGRKYYDVNINGNFDTDEKKDSNRLNGWTIKLYDNQWNLKQSMVTGNDNTPAGDVSKGQFRFENVLAGTYYVCEEPQTGWYQTEPSSGIQHNGLYCHTVNLGYAEDKTEIQFGNYQGSDVNICKKDNYNRSLSGWDIVLASEKVQSAKSINVSNSSGTSSSSLPAGIYLIKVSGTYRYGNTQMIADAGFSYRPLGIPYGTGGWVSGLDLSSKGLMAWVNGSSVNWGAYDSGHVYTYVYEHNGGPVNISIYDDNYGDNVNSNFTFEIFKVNTWAKGTTERNGCVTLKAVPYGQYILDEYLKDGWVDISGKGLEVTINDISENFTIKNRIDAPVTIKATKIVCDYEEDLPNWGAIKSDGNPITQGRIDQFLSDKEGKCRVVPDWEFEWAYEGAGNPGDEVIGYGGGNWNTFGSSVQIDNLLGGRLELREVLQENYIPFTYGEYGNNSNNESAEFYCYNDVMNYDNWEWLNTPEYGQTYYCVGFNTLTRTDVYGYKWLDIDRDGDRSCIQEEPSNILEQVIGILFDEGQSECEEDDLEPRLSGWKIFIDTDKDGKWDEGEQYMLTSSNTEDSNQFGSYLFEDLLPGEYKICEEMPEGWAQTYPGEPAEPSCHTITLPNDCTPYTDDNLVRVSTANAVETYCEFNFGNVEESELYISETNNSWPNTLRVGDTFKYIIKVRALKGPITDVILLNLPHEGFVPQSGTFSAISDVRGALSTSGVVYASPGEWDLGDMIKDEVITISYTALVTSNVHAGIHPDISSAHGTGVRGLTIFALAEESDFEINKGILAQNFVGTQVRVGEDPELEGGEVLGASITLPATGADTYITLGALISMIIGFLLMVFKPTKKHKTYLMVSILLLGIFTFAFPKAIYAQTEQIQVQMAQPVSPTNKTNFNIGFVALSIPSKPIEVQCQKSLDGITFVNFGTAYPKNTGNCVVDNTIITGAGTYSFRVVATVQGTSNSKESNIVAVQVGLEKPSPITEYSKSKGTCTYTLKFKSTTSKVQIYRSDNQKSFYADDTTLITKPSLSVTPNVLTTYTDSSITDCTKEYYYAIRSLDDYNNVSSLVTDDIVTIVRTPAPITPTEITGEEEGEVAGEETTPEEEKEDESGEVKGDEDVESEDEKEEEKEEDSDTLESFWSDYKYFIIAVLVVALGSGAYKYVRRKK